MSLLSRHRRPEPPQEAAAPIRRNRFHWRGVLQTVAALAVLGSVAGLVMLESSGYMPRQIGPFIERSAVGSGTFIENVGKTLSYWMVRLDRGPEIAAMALPAWPPATATATASPAAANTTKSPNAGAATAAGREVLVTRSDDLQRAVDNAEPGDTITVMPGRYLFTDKSIEVRRPGSSEAPIVLRGAAPGQVQFEFQMTGGIAVRAPYWRFEDLAIRGTCTSHDECEHAFHIVGAAHHTVLRRLHLEDFNAHVKINGDRGQFPDDGQLLDSVLRNTRGRETSNPVTLIDLVAASNWRIEGNLIADFVKLRGDRISYGAFAKGGGRNNHLLRNVVLCEQQLRGFRGKRVGLSLGGGGTSPAACRDKQCVVEQEASVIEANLVAQCSDDGVYLNAAAQSVVRNNTLLDTAGIEARFAETSADVSTNLVDGGIAQRGDAILHSRDNRSSSNALALAGRHPLRALFMDANALDLRWRGDGAPRETPGPGLDLCGGGSTERRQLGASDDLGRCVRMAAPPMAAQATP